MLRQGNCVKRFTDVATDSLQAVAGKSFLIRGLYVVPETDNTYLILKVDRKTVGVYRIYGRSGNHLGVMNTGYINGNLMDFLTSKGVNCSIPIAEGQSFTVSAVGTSPVVIIEYDTHDAGDIRADMVNGTDSKEYMFVQYMDTSDTVDATETVELDTSLSPAEFPDFPCGKAVPANTEITILGLAGCPCGDGFSEDTNIGSSFIKMVKDRETLFDEDRNGIPFRFQWDNLAGAYLAEYSLIGSGTPFIVHDAGMGLTYNITHGVPLMFDPSLVFKSGEELLMYMSFILAGERTLPADTIDIAAIMNVKVS